MFPYSVEEETPALCGPLEKLTMVTNIPVDRALQIIINEVHNNAILVEPLCD
jgi:hypothetical protein